MPAPREFPSASGRMDCTATSTQCDGQSKTDTARLACTSWCKPAYKSTHCVQCKCKACAFCVTRNPTWHDSGSSELTASQPMGQPQLLDVLQDRWLVLIGDSSIRMQFHFMLGVLALGWQRWPDSLMSRGPENPAWSSSLSAPPCLNGHSSHCMEDARIGRVRLTCLWSEFGESAHPSPSRRSNRRNLRLNQQPQPQPRPQS